MRRLRPPFNILASIRLAVFVILALAVVSSVGTIMEARYDAEVAQKLVYQSVYMYAVMILLCINLIGVMIDRWPWQRHHTGFIMAHVGIITLLIGSYVTQRWGIDGTILLQTGEERRTITVKDRHLSVYSSLDGNTLRSMYESEVDFIRRPPTRDKPFIVNLGQDELRFIRYEHFAFRDAKISESNDTHDGPAIRFQLENPNVNMTQWLRRQSRGESDEIDLGPAKIVLAREIAPPPDGRNTVVLITHGKSRQLEYVIYNKDNTIRKKGQVKQSETIETGWMGLQFRLLRYLPHSRELVTYLPSPTASPISTAALQFSFQGHEYWLGLNSVMRLYLKDHMYLISFSLRQLDLGFPIRLKEFRIGFDEGTEHAASYESVVDVPSGPGEVKISMNEPLDFKGFTLYQSSFEKDEQGKPVASILSANHDPGRWIKYTGSMMMVFGSLILFYFRRAQWLTGRRKGSAS